MASVTFLAFSLDPLDEVGVPGVFGVLDLPPLPLLALAEVGVVVLSASFFSALLLEVGV